MSAPRDGRGITLVELLVALTVTGLALASGYGAFASLIDHRERAVESSGEALRASAIRQTLRSWLEGARPSADPSSPSFRGLDGVHGVLADDRLAFVTTAETPLASRETVILLYVDRSEETGERGLVAELRSWEGSGTMRLEIDPRVAGLDIQYLSRLLDTGEPLPSWVSSTVLPLGAELRLYGGEEPLPEMLRLPFYIAFPGGQ